jgi:RNA polymerase sigma-70 factor (ECF subfamily)
VNPAIETRASDAGHADRLEALREGLRLLALRHLGGDPEAAAEVAQETIVRAFAALRAERLEDPAKLPAFVRGIARHVLADLGRARPSLPLDYQRPGDTPDPLASVISEEERAQVRTALASLPEADRRLLRLCFFDGLTPAQVAARLGEPPDRIRKRKSRALERLRAAFRQGSRSRGPGSRDKWKEGDA